MGTVLTNNRTSLINWIMNHELAMFFSLTFLLTWTFDGLVAIAKIENRDMDSILILTGTFLVFQDEPAIC